MSNINTERLFHAVFTRREGISNRKLIDVVYGDRPDGGPLTAANSISKIVDRINRRHLMPLGFKIVCDRGPSNAARRRLVRLRV